jgi:hypothetical protein
MFVLPSSWFLTSARADAHTWQWDRGAQGDASWISLGRVIVAVLLLLFSRVTAVDSEGD